MQDSWHWQHPYEDVWWIGSNSHERASRFGSKEEPSLGALETQSCKFSGADGGIKVSKGSMTILKGEQTKTLYKMIESIIIGDVSASTENDELQYFGACILDTCERGLWALHNKGASPGIKYCKLSLYKFCIMDRQRRVAFSTSQHMTKGLLDPIHTDAWGLLPATSIRDTRYYNTFIDDFSKRVWVCFFKQKSEVFQKFNEWKTIVENQKGQKVKVLRSDNGGEYTSAEFKAYLAGEGIKHQLSILGQSE